MSKNSELFLIPRNSCLNCGGKYPATSHEFKLCIKCSANLNEAKIFKLKQLCFMPNEVGIFSPEFLAILDANGVDEDLLGAYIEAFHYYPNYPATKFSMTSEMWVRYFSALATKYPAGVEAEVRNIVRMRAESVYRPDLARIETVSYLQDEHKIKLGEILHDFRYLYRLQESSSEELRTLIDNLYLAVWKRDFGATTTLMSEVLRNLGLAKTYFKTDKEVKARHGFSFIESVRGKELVKRFSLQPEVLHTSSIGVSRYLEALSTNAEQTKEFLDLNARFAAIYRESRFPHQDFDENSKFLQAAKDLEHSLWPETVSQEYEFLQMISSEILKNRTTWKQFILDFRWSYKDILETDQPALTALANLFSIKKSNLYARVFCKLPQDFKNQAEARRVKTIEDEEWQRREQDPFKGFRTPFGSWGSGTAIIDNRPRGYVARSWKNRWSK
jgi:hypothetical protein